MYYFTTSISHGVENYFLRLWGTGISDPGTSTSSLSSGVTVEGTGSSLVQRTGDLAVGTATQPVEAPGTRSCVAASKSATRPGEGPSTGVVIQQNATQPVGCGS